MLLSGSFLVRVSLRARIMPPSLPQTPTASAPARVIRLATCLLTVPASTISTTSTIAASVTRSPSTKVDWIASRFSIALICGPPPCTTTGLTPTCFSKRDVAAELLCQVLLAHRVATVLHHDGGAGVATQKRQRLGQHAGPLGGSTRGRRCRSRSCAACTGARPGGSSAAPLLDTAPVPCHVSVEAGSVKWKSAPPSSESASHIWPPCASTMPRQIDKPTPMPDGFVVTNGWNSFSRTSAGRPGPLSATLTSTMPSADRIVLMVSSRRGLVVHRLDGVADQIEQHLLNLHLVDEHERHVRRKIHLQAHPASLGPSNASAAASSTHLADVLRLTLAIGLLRRTGAVAESPGSRG